MDAPLVMTKHVAVLFAPEELMAVAAGLQELPYKVSKPIIDKLVHCAQEAHKEPAQETAPAEVANAA